MTETVLIGTNLRDLPVQRHFVALGSELVSCGFQVALVVHGTSNDSVNVDPRVKVLRWPSSRPTGIADALFFDRLVRKFHPCCVVSNFGAMSIMMTVSGLRRVPVRIHWYHTLSSQIEADETGSRVMLRFRRLRARIPMSYATHVVANSRAAKQDVVRTFGVPAEKCEIFWNSLNDPIVALDLPLPAKPESLSPFRFACVGRFAASKGQDIVLKAMVEVVRKRPGITVEFIGDGPEKSACEELARRLGVHQNCIFSGTLPHAKVLSRMARMWATIVPSRSEAFGLVNIESMAVGVPVVGSNTGGIAEIIRDGVDGFLFPPGDHGALSQRIIELIDDVSLRVQMSKYARRRFLEKFELSRAVRKHARWIIKQVGGATNEAASKEAEAHVSESL